MTVQERTAVDEAEELRGVRRRLHSIAELRFAEHRTGAEIESLLDGWVDSLTTGVAGTGLIARIGGDAPGPRVLLRADMDAYPVQEVNDLPYASTTPGVSHACGHDAHMTVMVGVLRRLAARRPERGSVEVLFQPAEEIPFGQPSGARGVLESGALAESYDAVLGLHCWPNLEAGSVGVDPKIAMAAKDAFRMVARGRASHAATPGLGRDALLAMSDLVTSLHAVIARRRNPDEMVALNVGTISGGASQSQVPEEVAITGTLRTHDPVVRATCKQTIAQLCEGVGRAHDVSIELTWADEMPSLVNAHALVELARAVGPEVCDLVDLPKPPLTTDDFALLAERWPGLYLKLGVAEPGRSGTRALHSGDFDIDERCLTTGVDMMERLTRAVLSTDERNR
ncbi:M20 metallopeptidase family protein [Microbacterium saperdae]